MKNTVRQAWLPLVCDQAFTLIELLVVIAIIAILAALLLPALAKTKLQGTKAYCLGNEKQLAVAFTMYAGDNKDNIVPYVLYSGDGFWLLPPGDTDSSFPALLGANTATYDLSLVRGLIQSNNPLYPFAPNVGIYHCPGDTRFNHPPRPGPTVGWAYDSYAKTQNVGGDPTDDYWGCYATYTKLAAASAASRTFIFAEQADWRGYNDGTFVVNWNLEGRYFTWEDAVSMYHGDVSTFAFADGHGEQHRWHNTWVIANGLAEASGEAQLPYNSASGAHDADYYYFYQDYRFPGWLPPP